jgi:hypothetical protein
MSLNETSINSTSDYMSFIYQAQERFFKYDRLLHVAFVFYIMVVTLLLIVIFADAARVLLELKGSLAVSLDYMSTVFMLVGLFQVSC